MPTNSANALEEARKKELVDKIDDALYQQNDEKKFHFLAREVASFLTSTGSDDEALIEGLSGQFCKQLVCMWYDDNKTDWRLGKITP